jgi:hypothetical protein
LWPQFEQNLAPGKNTAPQFGQAWLNFVPQFEQNLALSALDASQVGHSIVFSSCKAGSRQSSIAWLRAWVAVVGRALACYFPPASF